MPASLSKRIWRNAATLAAVALTACASPPSTTPQPASITADAAQAAGVTPDELALQQGFARWVAGFTESARAAGVDDATLHAAFDGARYVPRAVDADRKQPEFTRAVWDYVDAIVSPARVLHGQQKLAEVQDALAAAEARYGVPQATIVAIWGMESDYGANYGDIPTIDALATLGFEGRREAWARSQLMAALKILQGGDIDRAHMIGSWAGAMGQTQFLPSAFLSFAVDADGDGKRDIWGSMPDVTASTANFLARSGWQPGQAWGIEVKLPDGFDAGRADDALRQATAQWAAEGVRSLDGTPLPEFADGAILAPARARGPAFLVGPNFRAILRYNNSTSYALAVSLLSQRIAGGPGVQGAWPKDLLPLSRDQLRTMQSALSARGFDAGAADGQMGPATRHALRAFQRAQGLPADGYPTQDLLTRLQTP
ncbi:MAG: lytic murein transglycosylase [Caulobacter sp.]|nr:lytic murein transglycosylase [Vitreoscilla sp.]